jgi:hypothetical protein
MDKTQEALNKLADDDIAMGEAPVITDVAAEILLPSGAPAAVPGAMLPPHGPAVGIQLFASEDGNGIVVLHDEDGLTCAQVSLSVEQVDEMGAALFSLGNHLRGVDDETASIGIIDEEVAASNED